MPWATPTRTCSTKLKTWDIRVRWITGANSTRTVSYSQKQLLIYPFVPCINQGEKVKYILPLAMQDFFFYVYCTEDSTSGVPLYAGLSPLDQSLVSCYLWTFKISSRLVGIGQLPWEMPGVAHLVCRFEVSQRNTLALHSSTMH